MEKYLSDILAHEVVRYLFFAFVFLLLALLSYHATAGKPKYQQGKFDYATISYIVKMKVTMLASIIAILICIGKALNAF